MHQILPWTSTDWRSPNDRSRLSTFCNVSRAQNSFFPSLFFCCCCLVCVIECWERSEIVNRSWYPELSIVWLFLSTTSSYSKLPYRYIGGSGGFISAVFTRIMERCDVGDSAPWPTPEQLRLSNQAERNDTQSRGMVFADPFSTLTPVCLSGRNPFVSSHNPLLSDALHWNESPLLKEQKKLYYTFSNFCWI